MSKINKIKALLQNVLAQFAKMSTDKGLLSWDGDGELEVGMSVMLVDDEGNESVPENGEYRNEDGTVFVVEDGKVVEIREPEAEPEVAPEEAPAEEPAAEEPQENEEVAEEEPQSEEEPEEDPRDERIRNLEAEVARLEEELGAARERIAELEAKLDEPAAPPAEEQFEKVIKTNADDEKLNKLRKYFKN